jgi:hypothetical protein
MDRMLPALLQQAAMARLIHVSFITASQEIE